MRETQRADHVSLNVLIRWLQEGRFQVPDFQREFEWKPWDIRDLMRSIFLDYYIGSLLLWSGTPENFDALSCEPIYGYEGSEKPDYIVLDGQQRLTAMYYAFLAPAKVLPNRSNPYRFFIYVDRFEAEEYDAAFAYTWSKSWWEPLIHDPQKQYSEHIFPLAMIGEGVWTLPDWVRGYEEYWCEAAKQAKMTGRTNEFQRAALYAANASSFGTYVKTITEEYQVSYIELNKRLEIDKICDIFTKINSKGIQLDVFDLLNAMLKPKGIQLKLLWRKAAPRLKFFETNRMNVYILQLMSILRQGYCSPKYLYFLIPEAEKSVRDPDGTYRQEVLIADSAEFEHGWNEAVEALEYAIRLLRHPQEFGAISSSYLPYTSILPVFAAIQVHIGRLPSGQRLAAQRKVRHWYWASVFLNRYSGSIESTAARDFLDLKAWMDDDARIPDLIQKFGYWIGNLNLRSECRRGTAVYNGIFNLLVMQGAQDWIRGTVPQHRDLDDHHIIPVAKAKDLGIGRSIHSILNRTPLTAETNRRVIRDRFPHEYLPEMIKENGEDTVRRMLDSHFISSKALAVLRHAPFTCDDYEEFIVERQRTIREGIEDLLIKGEKSIVPAT